MLSNSITFQDSQKVTEKETELHKPFAEGNERHNER